MGRVYTVFLELGQAALAAAARTPQAGSKSSPNSRCHTSLYRNMSVPEQVLLSLSNIARGEIAAAEHLTERLPNDPRLQALFAKGVDTFGEADRFGRWLRAPSLVLGRSPLFCLADGDIESVESELIRIDYGDFA